MKENIHQEFLDHYQKVHAPLTRYCQSKAFGIMQTEDLVQEAVLAGLNRFALIRDKDKLLSYLIGTVNNIIKNKLRRIKKEGAWDESLMEKLESQTTSPEVATDIYFLLKELGQLPDLQQEALILFEISGFSIREVSEIQGSSEAATKTRLSRARKKLKLRLSDPKDKAASASLSKTLAAYASILF